VRVAGRRWNLRLDNGVDVELPEDDAAGAWHRLAELDKSDAILKRNIQAIDLRLPDRLVVRLVPEPPKPAAKKGRQSGKAT
jgi:cell division protein FtsQ